MVVTVAEMLFGGAVGAKLDVRQKDIDTPTFLFAESPSRLASLSLSAL